MSVACFTKRPDATRPSTRPGPLPFAGIGPKYMPPEGYNIRHDRDYKRRVLIDLWSHWGEWRRLHETVGGDFETVRDVVERGRRMGFEIEGDRKLGYRVVGWTDVPYLRPSKVMSEEIDLPSADQLTLEDCPQ